MTSLLYITEYPDTGFIAQGNALPIEPGQDTVLTLTASSQQVSFKNNTRLVRLQADTIPANVVFGTNPTAVTLTSHRIAAGQTEYVMIPTSQSQKIAAIISTS